LCGRCKWSSPSLSPRSTSRYFPPLKPVLAPGSRIAAAWLFRFPLRPARPPAATCSCSVFPPRVTHVVPSQVCFLVLRYRDFFRPPPCPSLSVHVNPTVPPLSILFFLRRRPFRRNVAAFSLCFDPAVDFLGSCHVSPPFCGRGRCTGLPVHLVLRFGHPAGTSTFPKGLAIVSFMDLFSLSSG